MLNKNDANNTKEWATPNVCCKAEVSLAIPINTIPIEEMAR